MSYIIKLEAWFWEEAKKDYARTYVSEYLATYAYYTQLKDYETNTIEEIPIRHLKM